jgi:hypothetical protein
MAAEISFQFLRECKMMMTLNKERDNYSAEGTRLYTSALTFCFYPDGHAFASLPVLLQTSLVTNQMLIR